MAVVVKLHTIRTAAVLPLLAGLLLRALTPLGYMPAAGGTGMFFELCPEQMPMAFSAMPTPTHSGHHHGADADQEAQTDADLCQVGHLLFSAIVTDDNSLDIPLQNYDAPVVSLASLAQPQRFVSNYRSRAPPA